MALGASSPSIITATITTGVCRWGCCCWLHGGLETRLLAFSKGDTEVQGHPGPSDVKGQGLFHVAQELDVLIWLKPGCRRCPGDQGSAFPLVNCVVLNKVGPSRPGPGGAVFPQRPPSQSHLLICTRCRVAPDAVGKDRAHSGRAVQMAEY